MKRLPSPSEGEGQGEGENVEVSRRTNTRGLRGLSPSPHPSPAGRGGDAVRLPAEGRGSFGSGLGGGILRGGGLLELGANLFHLGDVGRELEGVEAEKGCFAGSARVLR